MEAIIDYFATISSAHRSAILIGGLTIFFIIENAIPLFKAHYNKWKHSGLNIFFTLTTILVNFSMAFILITAAQWVENNQIGLLQWVEMNIYLTIILGLVFMDLFSSWLPHWIEHHIKWMWKFHLIHHTDQHVDTTTANRHHPGESVIRFVFTTIAVIIMGAPMWLVFMYQSLSVVLTQFNHSNINMPEWLDNTLVWVFCTPNMHRVHHHYRQPYSDKNYGNIFSIWDRVFGTYIKVDNSKLKYGVDTHMEFNDANNIGTLLKIPFQKYRQPISYSEEEKL
ncbi:MAG: sterol desaturase family protein [Saprospiraceae bacterium]|nr:sterol desaturase family protein [Saprospiraceae bacterium]